MPTVKKTLAILWSFCRTRWGFRFSSRAKLLEYQNQQLGKFLKRDVSNARFYKKLGVKDLYSLPIVTKTDMLNSFEEFNGSGIDLITAQTMAILAEQDRQFSSTLNDGISVGLSSGTSGKRSVFLVSEKERYMWAGSIMARSLSTKMLRRLCNPFTPPVRLAFFLRANSNLYTTVDSVRLKFRYFDLTIPIQDHLIGLSEYSPDIIIAPASVLNQIANAQLKRQVNVMPSSVISVAEVLEPDDQQMIEKAWNVIVQQIYQCTEGFLGYTCSEGSLHLNEEFVHFEPVWIDKNSGRCETIITDFTRHTQIFARFRMDDILQIDDAPCQCGRHSLRLKKIEGRHDDILWLPEIRTGNIRPLLPDQIRRSMMIAQESFDDYRIEQHNFSLKIRVIANNNIDFAEIAIRRELSTLCKSLGLSSPHMEIQNCTDFRKDLKRRRICCVNRPMETNLNSSLMESET